MQQSIEGEAVHSSGPTERRVGAGDPGQETGLSLVMLIDFLTANREELLIRARAKVAARLTAGPTEEELTAGAHVFLDQVVAALGRSPSASPRGAAAHGRVLLTHGYAIAQVVHDYSDVCQCIAALADETGTRISATDLQTLNLCLDEAIAEAVTEYTRLRDESTARHETERSGVFAHELRNKVTSAQLAFQSIRAGRAPTNGAVAAVLMRSLEEMTALVNRALVDVRLESGNIRSRRVNVRQLVEDAEVDGTMVADARGISLRVTRPPSGVDVLADPQILAGAIANVLQNAIKFTQNGGSVALRTSIAAARVTIEIEDECGGLPPGKAEELFGAFEQRGDDRSGLGLGLFISRKGIEASGGVLRVRDVPGVGCVFTIELPVLILAA